MKKLISFSQLFLIIYLSLSAGYLLSQEVHKPSVFSEAPIYFDNDVKMSMQLTVHFSKEVFPLTKGKKKAALADINPKFKNLYNYFINLEEKYGKIILTPLMLGHG